jgi:8-oxo-dGTP pyrophosphatase MutT (NUDIX family)
VCNVLALSRCLSETGARPGGKTAQGGTLIGCKITAGAPRGGQDGTMAQRRPRVVALAWIRRPGTNEILVSNSRDELIGVRFQRLFGGGVDFGERGEEALRRELREELGIELGMAHLAGVVENLFVFEGLPGHEVMLVYETEFADESLYGQETFKGIEEEPKIGVWRDLNQPDRDVPLYPPGLLDELELARG